MRTIDEVGRAAAEAALVEAAARVDADAGLARVRMQATAAASGAERTPPRWHRQTAMVAAAAAAVLVVVALFAFAGDGEQLPSDTLPTVPPTTTLAPLEPATSWFVPTVVETIDLRSGDDAPDVVASRLAVSPDGRWVAYRGTDRRACVVELVAGAAPTCHELDDFGFRQITWASDGSRFTGGDEPQLAIETQQWVVGVDGSVARVDAGLLIGPSFVPGGDELLGLTLNMSDDGGSTLAFANVDVATGEVSVLGPMDPGGLVASPLPLDDQRALVWTPPTPDAPGSVELLDIRSGSIRRVGIDTDFGYGWPSSVSADGDIVLVAGIGTAPGGEGSPPIGFEAWNVVSGRVVAFAPGDDTTRNLTGVVSPDGESVAAVWWRPLDGGGLVFELGVARIADLANGLDRWSVTELTEDAALTAFRPGDPQPVCWCRDGIVVASHQEAVVVRLDETTDPPR